MTQEIITAIREDINRLDLIPKLLQKYPNGKGVEIGVFKGEFTKHLLENWSGTMYLVDPWRELDEAEYADSSNHKNHSTAYLETMSRIAGNEDRAFMIRALSTQAAALFQDNSLDFVYIDGNHAYEWVKEDLATWWPKLKKGGLFAGHDYIGMDWYGDPNFLENGKDKHIWHFNHATPDQLEYSGVFGVNPAVDEFAADHKISFKVTNEFYGTFFAIK